MLAGYPEAPGGGAKSRQVQVPTFSWHSRCYRQCSVKEGTGMKSSPRCPSCLFPFILRSSGRLETPMLVKIHTFSLSQETSGEVKGLALCERYSPGLCILAALSL